MRKLLLGCLCVLTIAACKKQNEELTSPPLSDYFPLQVGKYIVYRLDSTVLTAFGAALTTRSYRVKDVVDGEITDAQGRKAYRIFRYLTDTAGQAPYRSIATFMATPNGTSSIEYQDNNLRFMKLRWPIRQATQWQGNSLFIDAVGNSTDPRAQYYANWNYEYDSIGMPYTLLGKTYDSTVKVLQRDETIPEGPLTNTSYQQKNFSTERYAKGIGLIYKEFLHYIWQPQATTPAHFEDGSYGVKLTIIEHN